MGDEHDPRRINDMFQYCEDGTKTSTTISRLFLLHLNLLSFKAIDELLFNSAGDPTSYAPLHSGYFQIQRFPIVDVATCNLYFPLLSKLELGTKLWVFSSMTSKHMTQY